MKLSKAQEESARLMRKYIDDDRFADGVLDLTAALVELERADRTVERLQAKAAVGKLVARNGRRPRRRRGSAR